MSLFQILPFNDEANYEKYIAAYFDWTGGTNVKLAPIDNTNQTFTEDFATDDGFTYDSVKAEFSGGLVRQKDMRGVALFGANFNLGQNANFAAGSATISIYGDAEINNNKLDLRGGTVSYAKMSPSSNLGINEGCIRFKYTPEDDGGLPVYHYVFCDVASVGQANEMTLSRTTSDRFYLRVRDKDGNIKINQIVGEWIPERDTEYEIGFNFLFSLGGSVVRLFVENKTSGDCEQIGSTITNAMERDAHGRLYFGAEWSESTVFGGEIDDIALYDSVQDTTDYAAGGYAVYDYIYVTSRVECPTFSYSGVGAIQAFTSFALTVANNAKCILNDLYYSGGWVSSDGSPSQSNTPAEVLAQIATLPASDTLNVDIIFADGSSQMTADALSITYTGQIYPTGIAAWLMEPNGVVAKTLEDLELVFDYAGSDTIKLVTNINGSDYWVNGGSWETSDNPETKCNTVAEILAAKATIPLGDGKTLTFKEVFLSTDGSTTPTLNELIVEYGFSFSPYDIPNCVIYGSVKSIAEIPHTCTVRAYSQVPFIHNNNLITIDEETSCDAEGKFIITLIELETIASTLDYGLYWDFTYIGDNGESTTYTVTDKNIVPNQSTAEWEDMEAISE